MIVLLITASLLTAQQGTAVFDDLVNHLVERLTAGNTAGIVRVVAGPGNTLELSGILADGSDELDIYRRLPVEGFKQFKRIGNVSAGSMEQLLREGIGGTLQPGDLLIRRGSKLVLSLRIAPADVLSDRAAAFLGRVIQTRLERSGLFRIEEAPDIDDEESVILGDLPGLRRQLQERHIDALINLLAMRGAGRLAIVYQLISGNPDEDDLFSFSSEMSPEFAVLMQSGAESERTLGSGSELIVSAPLSRDAIALAAIDADGQEGEELAVLVQRELQLFRFFDGRLQLYSRISLDSIPQAEFPTRLPAGHLFTADFDGDGKRELLASSNLWAVGCVIDFDGETVVSPLAYQPIAVIGNAEDLLVYTGTFRSGEDTYSNLVRILNSRGQTMRQSLFENLRSLYRLDDAGDRLIILHADWTASLWDRRQDETSVSPLGLGRLAALATSGNTVVFAIYSKRGVERPQGDGGAPIGPEIMIRIADPAIGEQGRTINLAAALDIRDITVYNPPAFPVRALAFLVKDNLGSISLDLYNWPE